MGTDHLWDLFLSSLPGPRMLLSLAPPLTVFAAAAAAFVGHLRLARGVRAPYTRKIFHFLVFTAAGLSQEIWGLPAVTLLGSIVTLSVLYAVRRGPGFPFYEAMARPSDEPRRSFFIVVPLATTALGGIASNILFPSFAHIGYLVCGWGDAVGEPAGVRWGRHQYRVPSLGGVPATRSLEGSLAVFLAGSAAAAAGLMFSGFAPRVALQSGLVCGLAGAAVEAISHHGLDNLTVQVAASAAAYLALVTDSSLGLK